MAQLMPPPLIVSCFSKIQIGFTFLVPAHPGSPGQRVVKWVCVGQWYASVYMLWPCLSVYLFQAGVVLKHWMVQAHFGIEATLDNSVLCWKGIWLSPKIGGFHSRTLSHILDLEEFCHSTFVVTSVVIFIQLMTIASLLHWASTFLHNTIGTCSASATGC